MPAPQSHNHRNVVIATEARKTAAVAGLRMAKDVGDLADRVVFVVDQVDLVVRVVGGFRGGPDRPGGFRGGPGGGPGGPGGGPPPEVMMRIMPVLAALDADGDGKISKAEIDNATAALKKLDKNNDGDLTAEEMRPDFSQMRRGPGGPGGPNGPGGPGRRGRPPQDDGDEAASPQRDRPDQAAPGRGRGPRPDAAGTAAARRSGSPD